MTQVSWAPGPPPAKSGPELPPLNWHRLWHIVSAHHTLLTFSDKRSVELFELTALQIITFMVFAIIGCVFAMIQLIVAAKGASNVDDRFGSSTSSKVGCVSDMLMNPRESRLMWSQAHPSQIRMAAGNYSELHNINYQPLSEGD